MKRRQGQQLPPGWCQDKDGKPITDPEKALTSGLLLPLGGDVGYKGYGLAVMIEVLCGILGGNFRNRNPQVHFSSILRGQLWV